jgi:hypothetical protein
MMGLVYAAFALIFSGLLIAHLLLRITFNYLRRNPSAAVVLLIAFLGIMIWNMIFPPPPEIVVLPTINQGLELSRPQAHPPEAAIFTGGLATQVSVTYANYAEHKVAVPPLLFCDAVTAEGRHRFVVGIAEPVLRQYFKMEMSDISMFIDEYFWNAPGLAEVYYTLTDPDEMLDVIAKPSCRAFHDGEEMFRAHPNIQFDAYGRVTPVGHRGYSAAYAAMPSLRDLGLLE